MVKSNVKKENKAKTSTEKNGRFVIMEIHFFSSSEVII